VRVRLPWLDHELANGDNIVAIAVVDRPVIRAACAAIRHPSGDWTIAHRIAIKGTDRRHILAADAHDGPLALAAILAMMTPDPARPVESLDEKQGISALNRLDRKSKSSSS
jgi:hypothetical protein